MATITANVGAAGNWNSDSSWIGGVKPTAADDAVIPLATTSITIDAGSVCRSADFNTFTGTITMGSTGTLAIGDGTAGAGNIALRLPSGGTFAPHASSTITFASTSGTQQTITSGGYTYGNITFNGAGGSWLLSDTLTTGGTLTVTSGTFNSGGQTCTFANFNSAQTPVRVVTLGASAITVSGNWDMGNSGSVANLTFNANTSVITMTGNSSQVIGAGKTFATVIFSSPTGTPTLGYNNTTFGTLTITGGSSKTVNLSVAGSMIVTGTLTINGNSSTNRILVRSDALGTSRTITAANVSITNADFRDITGAGAASWDLSAISGGSGDCGGNSGITFTTAATQTWDGTTGNWSTSARWTSRVPLPQDDVNVAASSAGTLTADMPRLGKSIDFTGGGGLTLSLTSTSNTYYGSLTLISAMTLTQNQNLAIEGRGSFTLTSAGKQFASSTGSITMQMIGGTLTLQDAFSHNNFFIVANGTFNTNNFSFSTIKFDSTGTATRAINFGSSLITCSRSSSSPWDTTTTTNLTFTAGTSTIFISDTGASSKTFAGGGLTYNDLKIAGGGAGAVIITGSNSFARLPQITGGTKTLQITAGTTQTFRSIGNDSFGNGSNVITIQSTSGGSTYTFSKATGIVSADYLSLQDSIANGGAEWYAGANSTNVSGNTGWYFTVPQFVASENLTKAGTSWVWGLDPNSYAYQALLQQEWVPSSSNATIGNNGLLTSAHLRQTYGNLTFFKDYGSGSSSVDADFAAGSPTGTWTVTRGATTPATTIDSQGRIQIVQHTGPRFTSGFYDSTGFVSRPGIIVEGASTNLLVRTDGTASGSGLWTGWSLGDGVAGTPSASQVAVTGLTGIAGSNAQRYTYTGEAGDVNTFFNVGSTNTAAGSVVQNDVLTASCWVRSTGTNTNNEIGINVAVRDSGGTLLTTHTTYFKSSLTSSWKRFSLTFSATHASSDRANFRIEANGIDDTETVDLEFWGAQLEKLPFATTFIPTTTAALTRNAETLTYPISGNRTAASESLFFKVTPFWTGTDLLASAYLTDSDTKRRILNAETSDKFRAYANASDSGSAALSSTTTPQKHTSYVWSAVYKHSSPYIVGYLNGSSESTYTSADWTDPVWGTNFGVGARPGGTEQFNGIIQSIAIFSDAKDATAVANITRTLQ